MAPKTAKKPVAKKAPAKKTVAKKATVKKTPVKKVEAPVMEMHTCGCGHDCKCAQHHCGCKCGRFFKKLVVFLIIFALGFACAKFIPCGKGPKHAPRPEFANGCLVTESVKCPKLVEMLATADVNNDGCINAKEFRAIKRQMRAAKMAKPAPAPEMPAPVVAE